MDDGKVSLPEASDSLQSSSVIRVELLRNISENVRTVGTMYKVHVQTESTTWCVVKSFSEFEKLNEKIEVFINQTKLKLPLFPKRKMWSILFSPTAQDEEIRRKSLEDYLNGITANCLEDSSVGHHIRVFLDPKLAHPHLVMIGGGHAHVIACSLLSQRDDLQHVKLTLISEYDTSFYSGMLPGWVGGYYQAHELEINLKPLAKWLNVSFIQARMTGLDPINQKVFLEDHEPVDYDVVSIDIGSVPCNINIPGVKEYALTTRPCIELKSKIIEYETNNLENLINNKHQARVIIVGGGIAATELACGFKARWQKVGLKTKVAVICGKRFLAEHGDSVLQNVLIKFRELDIDVIEDIATSVESNQVTTEKGHSYEYDLLVWATGAAPPTVLSNTQLPLDEGGYIRVKKTLQSTGFSNVFAAGDCASIEDCTWVAKAGVYAVRSAPPLANNLAAVIKGEPLVEYQPQTSYLALINTCDGEAISSWKGTSMKGSLVWKLKHGIDTKWILPFQQLDPNHKTCFLDWSSVDEAQNST